MDLFRRALPLRGGVGNDQQDFLRDCADLGTARIDRYRLYDQYYDGDQQAMALDRARLVLEANTGVTFTENFVETVIDSHAEVLKVLGFQVQDDEAASDWLTRTLWARTRMDETQGVVHTEVPKLGDGFIIVDFDAKRGLPRFRWNHPRLIKPVYDDDGQLDYLVKKWASTATGTQNPRRALIWRMNLYYPDRVEKWFSADKDGEQWAPWQDVGDKRWPVAWTESGELPEEGEADDALGVSAIHFRNKPKGRKFGRADTKGVIPFQNEITKQVLDLFQVMDAQGFQWPWITGIDSNEALKIAVGDVIRVTSKEAKVGQLAAANPGPLVEAIEATMRRMSAKTGTPLHDLIKGTPPSGEALKTAESRRTKIALDRQVTLGNGWEEAVRLGWHLTEVFGDDRAGAPAFDPDADITTVWDDPETRNEQAEAETLTAHSLLGASHRTLLRKLGYDPDEEAAQRAKEAKEAMANLPAVPSPDDPPVKDPPAE